MTLSPDAARLPDSEPDDGNALSPLQRAMLLAALYSDLFDYPLTDDELRHYLTASCPGRRAFDEALADLVPKYLVRAEEFLTLPGRQQIVELRRARARISEHRWPQARRYAAWLRRVPFLRMVAVCGSQAAGNPRADADIDFFVITESHRLWTVQVCAMMLRRFASLFSVPVCPNYLLTLESLEVAPHDLYHAREVAQAVPLWGGEAYERFRQANRWVDELLPNLAHGDDRRARLSEPPRSRVAGSLEWLLRGRMGNALEGTIHRLLLVYYPLRLRRRGWRKGQFRRAYRRDRQEVVRGGYRPVVERAYRQRASAHLPQAIVDDELRRLFPSVDEDATPDRTYANLFLTRYGRDA